MEAKLKFALYFEKIENHILKIQKKSETNFWP